MKRAFLIGNPVANSLSPRLHNHWCKKHNIDGHYEAVQLDEKDLDSFLNLIRAGKYIGANVTAPHKGAVLKKMDHLDPVAKKTGAVNTIIRRSDGTLEGRNSDPEGFIENLIFRAPGFDFENTKAVILGTGGAARGCIFALLEKGSKEIIVVGRNQDHLDGLLSFFNAVNLKGCLWEDQTQALKGAALLVNATPIAPPVDFTGVARDAIVYDLVYRPRETNLLKAAKKAGLKTVDGLGMLIHQAIPAFEAWFGARPAYDDELCVMLDSQKDLKG